MRSKRFFVNPGQIQAGTAVLSPDQSRHLRTVLRLGRGDRVELFDGEGGGYSGVVEAADRNVKIGSLRKLEQPLEPSRHLVLASAVIKSSRFDWVLEKGTELGVDYALTVSCYQADEDGVACGVCDSCRLRAEGFHAAGIVDPTRYRA